MHVQRGCETQRKRTYELKRRLENLSPVALPLAPAPAADARRSRHDLDELADECALPCELVTLEVGRAVLERAGVGARTGVGERDREGRGVVEREGVILVRVLVAELQGYTC